MNIKVKCVGCGETTAFEVPERGFRKWKEGALIQNALPELSDDERELLISQLCPDCFNEYPDLTLDL